MSVFLNMKKLVFLQGTTEGTKNRGVYLEIQIIFNEFEIAVSETYIQQI